MKKSFIFLLTLLVAVALISFWLLWQHQQPEDRIYSIEESREIAFDWIINDSAIYQNVPERFSDGWIPSIIEESIIDQGKFQFIFGLYDAHLGEYDYNAGLGEGAGRELGALRAEKTVHVIVDNGKVINVVVDGVHDELSDRPAAIVEGGEVVKGHTIEVYFLVEENGETLIEGLNRPVYMPNPSPTNALHQLLVGPTSDETERGFFAVDPNINISLLSNVTLDNGTMVISFNKDIERLFGMDSNEAALFEEQVVKTLFQFEEIREIIIMLDMATITTRRR